MLLHTPRADRCVAAVARCPFSNRHCTLTRELKLQILLLHLDLQRRPAMTISTVSFHALLRHHIGWKVATGASARRKAVHVGANVTLLLLWIVLGPGRERASCHDIVEQATLRVQ